MMVHELVSVSWVTVGHSFQPGPPWENVQEGFFDKVKLLSSVRLFVTLWTVTYQASPSMGFSRQEYQSGLPFPSPGDLPNPGIKPGLPHCKCFTLLSYQGFF